MLVVEVCSLQMDNQSTVDLSDLSHVTQLAQPTPSQTSWAIPKSTFPSLCLSLSSGSISLYISECEIFLTFLTVSTQVSFLPKLLMSTNFRPSFLLVSSFFDLKFLHLQTMVNGLSFT